jgi:hypothetical protein
MDINLKARLVAAIAQFKADRDIRFYLNGVYLEPHQKGGAIIAATNGHAMGIWHDESATGVERAMILGLDAKLLQACQGSDLKRLVVRDGRLAVILEQGEKEVYIQPIAERKTAVPSWEIEGKFPDWRRVIPEPTSTHGLKGFVNAQYIADVDRALKIGSVNYSKFNSMQFMQLDANSAVLVTAAICPEFAAVIMPMRDDCMPYPAWLELEKAEWKAKQNANAPESNAA